MTLHGAGIVQSPLPMSSPEEKIMSLGAPVEDPEFINLLRSRLHSLLNLTRYPDMFPGSQPVSFEQRHLDVLERDDYYVCEKSDGVRYLLYFAIPPSGPVAFLIDRNYHFRALDHLTLPTRDLKAFQEETLLDGELVWDERKGEMIYFIFDGLMFNAKNICGLDLNGRLQVIQNDVIGPYEKREGTKKANATIYEQSFPFKMKMKQMWKPYGLKELFERVIPAQGHENDGLIFTPVKDTYQAGTCHRLLKWKPSELNSIDFLICAGSKDELWIASQGRCHYYCDFDPKADEKLKEEADINDRIAEFRLTPNHPNKWTFMRFRPDKRLPNDSKTVEKVIQSIKDNVKRSDLVERETVIRANWKARELKGASAGSVQGANTKVPANTPANNPAATADIVLLIPRSQRIKPPVSFKYPLNLRTDTAKNEYKEADGWFDENESEDDESDHAESVKDSSSITDIGLCYDLDSEEEKNNLKKKRARTK